MIEKMADIVITEKDPVLKEEKRQKAVAQRKAKKQKKKEDLEETAKNCEISTQLINVSKVACVKKSRYIAKSVKHEVWKRDSGCCTYRDPLTGKVCGSNYKIQYEHRIPWAKGGLNTAENLTLHCSRHNGLMAAKVFGKKKIDQYKTRSRPG